VILSRRTGREIIEGGLRGEEEKIELGLGWFDSMEDGKEVRRFTWSDEKTTWWMGLVKGMLI
jgi:hypothetical protein